MTERWLARADAFNVRLRDVENLRRSLDSTREPLVWDAYVRMLERERARRVAEGGYEFISRFALKAYSPPRPSPRERVY